MGKDVRGCGHIDQKEKEMSKVIVAITRVTEIEVEVTEEEMMMLKSHPDSLSDQDKETQRGIQTRILDEARALEPIGEHEWADTTVTSDEDDEELFSVS